MRGKRCAFENLYNVGDSTASSDGARGGCLTTGGGEAVSEAGKGQKQGGHSLDTGLTDTDGQPHQNGEAKRYVASEQRIFPFSFD